jgi:lysophospholipase L1-like esterase
MLADALTDPLATIPKMSTSNGTPDSARPRLDPNSQKAHAQLLEKARRGRIDVYFEGDSITRRWGATDPQYKDLLANWKQNFFGWNAANFGWGGDTVQNVLWRLKNGESDGVHPKVIVLMAGTNNLEGHAGANDDADKVQEVTAGIESILRVMREKAPEAIIILMGITPRGDPHGVARARTISRINEHLSRLADGKRNRFLNINTQLEDGDGKPLPGMTVDGLHLTLKAYQIWADALKPILRELLGPPASTDLAPPPTGNPSLEPAKPQQRPD